MGVDVTLLFCEGVVNLVIAVLVLLVFLYLLKQYRKGLKEYCEYGMDLPSNE